MGNGRYLASKSFKTKRYTKDVDQVLYVDMKDGKQIDGLKNHQEMDENKPGMGQFYCIPCAKYFETQNALTTHLRAKVHKRRLKDLKNRPYTQEESDFAAGKNVLKYLEQKKKQEELLKSDVVTAELAAPVDKLIAARPNMKKQRAVQLLNKYQTAEKALEAVEQDPKLEKLPGDKMSLEDLMMDLGEGEAEAEKTSTEAAADEQVLAS